MIMLSTNSCSLLERNHYYGSFKRLAVMSEVIDDWGHDEGTSGSHY